MSIYDSIRITAHTLIAGTTGAGKSTALHTFICDTIQRYNPNVVRFVLIDLKRVEMARYKNIKHTLDYANTPADAVRVLQKYDAFMRTRYREMEAAGLTQSNNTHIYIIVDELADLLSTSKEALNILASIGRLGRAANIHLILATQSPSRKTLPATLQQNFTFTLALKCKTAIESRQVLGIAGAEQLRLCGDCIVWNGAAGYSRGHIEKIPDAAINEIIKQDSGEA